MTNNGSDSDPARGVKSSRGGGLYIFGSSAERALPLQLDPVVLLRPRPAWIAGVAGGRGGGGGDAFQDVVNISFAV